MAMAIEELSLFLPIYNEEGNIRRVVLASKRVLEKVAGKWEMILVDDGSSDGTPEILKRITAEDKRIKVVTHEPNKGYGAALKTGFLNSKYKWITFMDSDGQFDFSEITKFTELKDSADLILGVRKNRADSLPRKIFTFGWSLLAKLLLGLKATDYSCGFKMIKKEVIDAVLPLNGEEKVTQIELLVKARKLGFRFAEVNVKHYPRKSGVPTGANLKVVVKSLVDLIKLWKQLN